MKTSLCFLLLIAGCFPAAAQLHNAGFEDTTAGPVQDSSSTLNRGGWYLSKAGAKVSTDSHSGNYALSIWNWYYYSPGQLTNTDGFSGGALHITKEGLPMTQKPAQLSGYYKFIPGDNGGFQNDSAVALVMAHRWNALLNRRDTVAFGVIKLRQTSAYLPFTMGIADFMPGTNPDTVFIGFWSCNRYEGGHCQCTSASGAHCLYLTVDDLAMTTPTGIIPLTAWFSPVSIYPNPVLSELTIDLSKLTERSTVMLYDATGWLVAEYPSLTATKHIIQRGALPAGFYSIAVFNSGKAVCRTKITLQ